VTSVTGAGITLADAFSRFKHDAWQHMDRHYDDFFGTLTTQCIEPLLNAVGTTKGTRPLQA